MSPLAFFIAATCATVGSGETTFFWEDPWLEGCCIKHLAPTVYAAVLRRRRRTTTVRAAILNAAWVHHIEGPRTVRLIAEFLILLQKIQRVSLVPGVPDTFTWKLSADQSYSASSAYGAMFLGCSTLRGAKHIWKTSAPPRVRFFVWLAMHGRCWTAHRRWRHGLQEDASCALCNQADETIHHLLLGCVYSREVWAICLRMHNLDNLIYVTEGDFIDWWIDSRSSLPKALRKGFDTFFFLIAWSVWKQRNAWTFNGPPLSPLMLSRSIKDELQLWVAAGYKHVAAITARV